MVSDRATAEREYRQGDHICLVYNTPAEQLGSDQVVDYEGLLHHALATLGSETL